MTTSDNPGAPSDTTFQRIDSLDSLRAIAVILVFLLHLREVGKVDLPAVFQFGWIGVDLFYVLSGFFIGTAVLRSPEWQPWVYVKHRVYRIVPAYYVSMALMLVFSVPVFLTSWDGFKHILSHLLFVHNLSISTHGSINGVYWTLGVEASFYALMGLVAPFLRRSPRTFVLTIGMFFIVTYVWRIAIYQFGSDDGFQRYFVATQLPGMLDQFAIGILVAYVHLKTDWVSRISGVGRIILLIATVFTCVTAFSYLSNHAGDYWFDFLAITFWRSWIAAGFAMWILLLLASPSRRFDTLLRYSLLGYTGKISYSIYLYHIPVILSVTFACKQAGLGAMATIFATAVTTWLVAMSSYRWVERGWNIRARTRHDATRPEAAETPG